VHPRLSKIKVTKLPGARKHNTVSFTLNRACSRSCIAKEGSLLAARGISRFLPKTTTKIQRVPDHFSEFLDFCHGLLVSMRDLKSHQNTFRKFDLLEQQAPI